MSRSTPWEPLELSRDMDKLTCYVGKFSKWLFPWASGSLGVAWDGKAGSAHMLSPSSSSFPSHQGAGRGNAGVKDQCGLLEVHGRGGGGIARGWS